MPESSNKQYYFLSQVFQNSLIGGLAVTGATPCLVWTNRLLSRQPVQWRGLYQGYSSYALAIVPTTIIALSLHHYLLEHTSFNDIVCSGLAGSISAFASTPFEALAQNKQTQQQKAWPLAKRVWRQYGFRRLFTGNLSVMMREGLYVSGYLNLTPMLKTLIDQQMDLGEGSDLVAALAAGSAVGVATTPLHCLLRHGKQEAMMNPQVPSYFRLAVAACHIAKGDPLSIVKRMFRGVVPRTATSAVAITCVFEAKKLVQQWMATSPESENF